MVARHYRALVDGYEWTDENGVAHRSRMGDRHYLTDAVFAAAGSDKFDFATEDDRAAKAADDKAAADKAMAEKPAAKTPVAEEPGKKPGVSRKRGT